MNAIRITRTVRLPDPLRISRYRKAPELGPSLLFFSGGSALRSISQTLKNYTHNSIHMVTPFDSGGSSAKLRQAFHMPSIGDLRSRMMALADETITGHPEVYRLFTYRFPMDDDNVGLLEQLDAMLAGKHPMLRAIPNPMRRLIRNQIGYFRSAMPADFNLRGASIGNLILAGGYLNNHQHLDPIIFLFSKLVGVLGTVRAVVNDDLHLAAELEDGSLVCGQSRLTGKEVKPLTRPIRRLMLSQEMDNYIPAKAQLRKKNRKLIERADLLCFAPGSFYTSLIANLLPMGVGAAIAANDAAKIYIPNLGRDPEQIGMTAEQSLETLLDYLRADAGRDCPADRLLNFVVVDSGSRDHLGKVFLQAADRMGLKTIDTRLVSEQSAPYYDPELLVNALLSLT